MDTFLHYLKAVLDVSASALGVMGTLVLIALVLGAVLFLVYMILRFGESGIEMLLPLVRGLFQTLSSEITKAHPAIRVELTLHVLFGTILVLSLFANLLHALVPWVRGSPEHLFLGAFITSTIVCIVLAGVSVTIAVRLK